MSTYLWYSKNSTESGTLLAKLLGIDNAGTVPPQDFAGTVVSFGATYDKVFKWEKRNFQAILNDPRRINSFRDRLAMFNLLSSNSLNTLSCVALTNEAQYATTCSLLGVAPADGIAMTKQFGSEAVHVNTVVDFEERKAQGYSRAIEPRYMAEERIRIFVVDKHAVGGIQRHTPDNNGLAKHLAQLLSGKAAMNAVAEVVLRDALNAGLVTSNRMIWGPAMPANIALGNVVAEQAAHMLELDFCAVDIILDGQTPYIINVVTAPDLREATSVHGAIAAGITTWIKKNSMTAKQILLSIINDADDDEAMVILEELRAQKKQLQSDAQG